MEEENKPQQIRKTNPLIQWFNNVRNVKKNYQKVRASPFASLRLALRVRQIIVLLIVPWLAYETYVMVKNYHAAGFMQTVGQVFMIGIMAYVCYTIYKTIPQAKKQIEYYRKYPHTINYAPLDTKETIDQILKKVENNKKIKESEMKDNQDEKEVKSNGIRKKEKRSS